MYRRRDNGFTFAEILVSLMLISIITVMLGQAINTTVKSDVNRSMTVAIKQQNISVLEGLRNNVNSRDDMYKVFKSYSGNVNGMNCDTTANVSVVEGSKLINLSELDNKVELNWGSQKYNTYDIKGINYNNVYMIPKDGILELSRGNLSQYNRLFLNIVTSSGVSILNISGDNTPGGNFNINGSKYINMDISENNDAVYLYNMGTSDIYIINSYLMSKDNVENNVFSEKNISNDYPSLLKVTLHTEVINNNVGNKSTDTEFEKYNSRTNDITTYIYLKESGGESEYVKW